MRKIFFIPLLVALIFNTNLSANGRIHGIKTENRLLARVHTETISVLDLQKRLDLSIAESNPDILNNLENKYMYYLQNWAPMLNNMINNKLIAAEGKKLKIVISDCDVNEQLKERFGLSPLAILSKCNLNLEEAKAIIYEDLVVNGMSWHRVYSKTHQQLTPSIIKNTYAQYKQSLEENKEITYQYITIRANEPEEANALSEKLKSLMTINQIEKLTQLTELTQLTDLLKASTTLPENVSFTISEPVTTKKNDLSENRLKALSSLKKLSISDPISQDSEKYGKTIRYYQLLDETTGTIPTFEELQTTIKNSLFENISNQEMTQYISRLKQEFFFDEKQLKELEKEKFIPFTTY